VLPPNDSPAARSLQDLRRAQPADATLQNLLGVLSAKLELCARLPIFEYEASAEDHDDCADAFRVLADRERASFNALLDCLRRYLQSGADRGEAHDRTSGRKEPSR
jgi:hypothetical protein